MPINAEDIVAAPAAETPAPSPEPAATPPAPFAEEPKTSADDKGDELPDELLKEVPALQLLLHGAPPATVAPKDAEYPELKVVAKHLKDLGKAGFGVYQTQDKANVVFFNGLYVSPDDVKAADEAGTLDKIAVPYDELRGALGAQDASASASEPAAAPSMPPADAGAPASPAAESKLATARIKNTALGTPTSGPAPGQGRILNNIVKPVI